MMRPTFRLRSAISCQNRFLVFQHELGVHQLTGDGETRLSFVECSTSIPASISQEFLHSGVACRGGLRLRWLNDALVPVLHGFANAAP